MKQNAVTRNRLIIGALILIGGVIVVFFGLRAVHALRHLHGHGPLQGKPPPANQTDVTLIREWMTVPYIAHLYNVPPEVVWRSLDIKETEKDRRRSLDSLNNIYYPDQPGAALAHVQAVMQALQKQDPPPKFPATPFFTPTPTP